MIRLIITKSVIGNDRSNLILFLKVDRWASSNIYVVYSEL